MIVVAPFLVPCGSLRGGHLEYQHDAHILSYRDATRSVPRHAPHDTPRNFPRGGTYLRVCRGLAHGTRRDGPRDHPRVDSRVDPRGVPRRLPKTHACTKQDDAATPTTYRTTNSSDSKRA